jgi:hypothetical protein
MGAIKPELITPTGTLIRSKIEGHVLSRITPLFPLYFGIFRSAFRIKIKIGFLIVRHSILPPPKIQPVKYKFTCCSRLFYSCFSPSPLLCLSLGVIGKLPVTALQKTRHYNYNISANIGPFSLRFWGIKAEA